MAFLPLTLLPTLAKNSLPTTLGLRLHSNPGGYDQNNNAPANSPLPLSSRSLDLRHKTLQSCRASPPFPPPSALNAACVSAPEPNAPTANALATTPSNASTRLSAAAAPNHTLLGTIPAPQLPVQPMAAFAHMLHPCELTVTGSMRHTLPPVQNARFIRTVLVLRMMIRIACSWSAVEEVTRDGSCRNLCSVTLIAKTHVPKSFR